MNRFDAVVIGSGLGGLSAAAYLAAAGQRVLVLERYSVLGGSSHVFRRQGKWEFDVGVHYIGDCGPEGQVPTLLRGLGLDDRIDWLPLDTDAFDTIIGPDLELKVPVGWDNYLANLLEAFPGEERGLRRYVSVMRKIGGQIDRSRTPASKAAMAKAVAGAGTAAPWFMAPHAALLVACGLKPRTILALSVQDGALATTPQASPVMMRAGFLQNFVGGGAWFPKGGGQMLSAGFAEVVRSHGGELRTNQHVERIVVEGGRVTGVRLADGETISTPVVVSGADIIRTYRDLVGYEHLPRVLRMRIDRWKMARPLINAYFGIEVDLSDTPNTNFYTIPTWDDATSLLSMQRMSRQLIGGSGHRDRLAWATEFARRQTGYVQSSTRRDPSNKHSAPAGHAAIEVQTLAPPDPALWGFDGYDVATGEYRSEKAYREIKQVIADGMLERVEQAFPGASTKVRWSELATPATQERFTHSTLGTSYGLEPRIDQVGPLRPGSRTPVRGLFLAGTSTAWGPATEGSMLSGLHAAGAVLGRDLAEEVRAGAVIADPSLLTPWGPDFDPLQACRGLSRERRPSDEEAAPLHVAREHPQPA